MAYCFPHSLQEYFALVLSTGGTGVSFFIFFFRERPSVMKKASYVYPMVTPSWNLFSFLTSGLSVSLGMEGLDTDASVVMLVTSDSGSSIGSSTG